MSHPDLIDTKFRTKFDYTATTGVIGKTGYKVPGENKLRVSAPIDGSGTLAVQGRIFDSDTWINLGELNSTDQNKTFNISTYDVIRFNLLVSPTSAGEVAAAGFFSGSGSVSVETDSGTIEDDILKIIGGTNINTSVVGDEIIIDSTALTGALCYDQSFIISNWVLNAPDYELTILASTHGLGTKVDGTVYEKISTDHIEVLTDILVTSIGDVILKINSVPDTRFDGRVHLKEC